MEMLTIMWHLHHYMAPLHFSINFLRVQRSCPLL